MISVGTDIIEISRIARAMQNPRFLTRVFSSAEISYFESKNMRAETVAGNFCAKEAFVKAMGTGLSAFSLPEISIERNALGAPFISFSGAAYATISGSGLRFSVSISHCRDYATAVVVAESV